MKYKSVREATVEFVRLGYGDSFGLPVRSLRFETEPMRGELAQEVVAVVKGYNAYKGTALAKAVKLIGRVWTSEAQQVAFAFGREASPVLYIYPPYWLSPAKKFEEAERLEKIRETVTILKSLEPDELAVEHGSIIRAWWD